MDIRIQNAYPTAYESYERIRSAVDGAVRYGNSHRSHYPLVTRETVSAKPEPLGGHVELQSIRFWLPLPFKEGGVAVRCDENQYAIMAWCGIGRFAVSSSVIGFGWKNGRTVSDYDMHKVAELIVPAVNLAHLG